MEPQERPLSPHIQIYKPQLTSILSITHRITGVFLFFGSLFLSGWLISATYGEETFSSFQEILSSWLGQLVLFSLTLSLFYHLGNGIRHLWWDLGKGYDLKEVQASGLFVIAFALIMSVITWITAYSFSVGP